MSMTIIRRRDRQLPRVIVHKVADIRGGVSVATSDLGGDTLTEGTYITAPTNGICNVVKTAVVLEDVSTTGRNITIRKGHNFKVGDVVMASVGGAAKAISTINTSAKTSDTLTLSATLGEAISAGAVITEADEAASAASNGAGGAVLKQTPFAIVGSTVSFAVGTNIDVDAWLIAVTTGSPVPSFYADALKGIFNY